MTNIDKESVLKPPLYRGHPLPLASLSSDAFEDFVYQVLVILGKSKGFEVLSGRQSSGDQGFDCLAKSILNRELICIQCKRYNATLYTRTVAEEIIKVALDNELNRSNVKEHYIITCGSIANKLRSQLRQNGYIDLKTECNKILSDEEFKYSSIDKIKEKNISPFYVVCEYLDSLSKLIVWSRTDFENEMSVIWSELTDILEHTFSLDISFKEHPRPDFDIFSYIEKKRKIIPALIPLQYKSSNLPNNLLCLNKIKDDFGNRIVSINDIVNYLKINKSVIISSLGGSGKSSTLSILEKEFLEPIEGTQYIPIKINLRSYSRNSLKERINQELNINHGSWRSLPFKFIFLFDALDEMLEFDNQAFIDEINNVIEGYSYIITLRNTGLNVLTEVNSVDTCLSILPLSYRSILKIAEVKFGGEDLKNFYDEYREKLASIGFDFLSLPFVLSLTLKYYEDKSSLPNKTEEVLENWIKSKIKYDSAKVKEINTRINKIPTGFIEDAISLLVYKFRVECGLSAISEEKYYEVLMQSYDELDSQNSYITRCLDFNDFKSMITQYEVLTIDNDGYYSTPHSIISDYLVSKLFAKNWRTDNKKYLNNIFQDIWFFSSNYIEENDKSDFLQLILSFDLVLSARIGRKFGGKYLFQVQEYLLEKEQSLKVLERSSAIYALGILATESSLDRLKSINGYIDYHHGWQRVRSLALNGNKDTLIKILKENAPQAQGPMTISGGSYDIWFSSPPAIITDIARSQLQLWINMRDIPLFICLKTLEFYGDSYDVDILVKVIKETKIVKEFYQACHALSVISFDSLVYTLNEIIDEKQDFSYEAKQILIQNNINVSIDDEFDDFIQISKKNESELSEYIYQLDNFIDFIKKCKISKLQAEILADTYIKLNFKRGFYYYGLLWSIASFFKLEQFLPIIELALKRQYPEEMNQALYYLSCLNPSCIKDELRKNIDDYYSVIDASDYQVKLNYSRYYLSIGKDNKAFDIICESLKELLIDKNPEDITYNDYIGGLDFIFIIFDFLNLSFSHSLNLEVPIKLKVLLIDSIHISKEKEELKKNILKQIPSSEIYEYFSLINDESVKIRVVDFLLKYDLVTNSDELVYKYMPNLLSHHMYYSTLKIVSEKLWSDEYSVFFLQCFINQDWDNVNAQLFESDTYFYAKKFTSEQLKYFEACRDKPINKYIDRIYKIWLEYNNI